MGSNNQTVFIIDDNAVVCSALRSLFESVNYTVETYLTAQAFLEHYNNKKTGCIIIDVRLPDMSGLELLQQLNLQKNRLPVILITGYGDIPMVIRAMKLGARDFLLKPLNEQYLLECVQQNVIQSGDYHMRDHINDLVKRLSERERQVIHLICDGKLNKEIAYELSISMSTVEVHRANIMKKMQAKTLAQLIKLYIQSQHDYEFI